MFVWKYNAPDPHTDPERFKREKHLPPRLKTMEADAEEIEAYRQEALDSALKLTTGPVKGTGHFSAEALAEEPHNLVGLYEQNGEEPKHHFSLDGSAPEIAIEEDYVERGDVRKVVANEDKPYEMMMGEATALLRQYAIDHCNDLFFIFHDKSGYRVLLGSRRWTNLASAIMNIDPHAHLTDAIEAALDAHIAERAKLEKAEVTLNNSTGACPYPADHN